MANMVYDVKQHMSALRKRSGEVNSNDRLVCFLYILMRDHLPVGKVEGIIVDQVEGEPDSEYTNGWLANYAKDLAARLK